jgi:hypothetical protein
MAHKLLKSKTNLPKTSTLATTSFNNMLLANVDTNTNTNTVMPQISQQMQQQQQQATILNKEQLQQCLIHMLNSDDKFLSSLHQAYLATSLTKQANQNSSSQ